MGVKFGKKNRAVDPESEVDEGFADMDAWLASREKEKGTGKFDKRERTLPSGIKATTYTRRHEDEPEDDSDAPVAKGGAPKKRGRPMGKPKGPERITKGAWKHKGERKVKEGSNCCPHCGESLEEEELDEFFDQQVTVKGGDARTAGGDTSSGVSGVSSTGGTSGASNSNKNSATGGSANSSSKANANATANADATNEETLDKEDQRAERAGKKVAKDIEYDEGHKSKDDNRAEKAGKKVTKDIEYDDKKDREEKVEETSESPKSSKGGYNFGGSVYESLDKQFNQALTEGMSVNVSVDEQGKKTISVNATDDDAESLAQLLKMAGLGGGENKQEVCPGCGSSECGCEKMVDENSPDWPTNTETSHDALQYSGGLNKPKAYTGSTGQTTTPITGVKVSMEENVELERSLFKLYKDISGK